MFVEEDEVSRLLDDSSVSFPMNNSSKQLESVRSERDLYKRQADKLYTELNEQEKQRDQLLEQVSQLKDTLADPPKENEDSGNQKLLETNRLGKTLNQERLKYKELETKYSTLKQEDVHNQASLVSLQSQNQLLQDEESSLKVGIASLTEQVASISRLKEEIASLERQIASPHPTTPFVEKALVCECESSMFDNKKDQVEFYLPLLAVYCSCGKQEQSNVADPCALKAILRPWQVKFLRSLGIKRAQQLVQMFEQKHALVALGKQLRKWRKQKRMIVFKSQACSVALRIWLLTCKTLAFSVQKQQASGVKPHRPSFLNVKVLSDGATVSEIGASSPRTMDLSIWSNQKSQTSYR
jgi:hypothetical protein